MRIFKDSAVYLIGELFSKILPFLMLPYLTRKLGPDGFGELSYYLTWLALFGIFIGLSQEGAVTRYYYFYGTKGLSNILRAGYFLNIICTGLILIGCWFFSAEIISYIVLATAFQSFLNVQLALRQCQKQPLKYVTIQIILSILTVVFTISALEFFSENLVKYRILAIVLANLLTFLIANILLNKFNHKNVLTIKRFKLSLVYIVSYGFPLILHQSSFFIKGQLDRIFIYEKYSKTDLGIYSAGVQVAAILPVVLMALNKAIVPYYYQGLKERKLNAEKIKKYSLLSMIVFFIPALISFLLPMEVYRWFLGEEYSQSKYYVVLYLLGYGLNLPYLILVNYYFYYGKNKFISMCSLVSSVFYFFFLLLFVNISIEYVPYALCISNIFLIILFYFFLRDNDAS